MSDKQVRAHSTREIKKKEVKKESSGQPIAVVAKVLGIPKASLGNWVRLQAKGELDGAGCRDKSIRRSPEQMKILQLRAKNARLRMERDIAKKPRRTSRRTRCEVRLESPDEKTVPGDAEHHGDTSGFRDDVTLAAQLDPIHRFGVGVQSSGRG